MGLDTKTYWLTDRQSQCDFDFELGQFCTRVCKEKTSASEAEESPMLETVARERLVKTQQAGKGLVGVVVICKSWILAEAL
jgi:hypothetical protein